MAFIQAHVHGEKDLSGIEVGRCNLGQLNELRLSFEIWHTPIRACHMWGALILTSIGHAGCACASARVRSLAPGSGCAVLLTVSIMSVRTTLPREHGAALFNSVSLLEVGALPLHSEIFLLEHYCNMPIANARRDLSNAPLKALCIFFVPATTASR